MGKFSPRYFCAIFTTVVLTGVVVQRFALFYGSPFSALFVRALCTTIVSR